MALTIENHSTGFRVLNDNVLVLKAERMKWYSDAVSYEYSGNECQMIAANFFRTKLNLIKNGKSFGEITWKWDGSWTLRGLLPWTWGLYTLKLDKNLNSYYLKRKSWSKKHWSERSLSYVLKSELDSEAILTIKVEGGVVSTEEIKIEYHISKQDQDLLAFALFSIKAVLSAQKAVIYHSF